MKSNGFTFHQHYLLKLFPLSSSVVVIGDNVSYVISGASIKPVKETPYYSSVLLGLPRPNLVRSIQQPLPVTPLEFGGAGNEGDGHICDNLGEQQTELHDEVGEEQMDGESAEEKNAENDGSGDDTDETEDKN